MATSICRRCGRVELPHRPLGDVPLLWRIPVGDVAEMQYGSNAAGLFWSTIHRVWARNPSGNDSQYIRVSGSTTMVNDPSPMAGGGPAWNTASAWGPGFLAGTFGGGGDGGACPNTVGDGTSTGLQKVAATKRRHGHLALVEGIAMKPFAGRTAR